LRTGITKPGEASAGSLRYLTLADKIGLKEQGKFIWLLHDFIKYSKEFQPYLQSAVGLVNQDEDGFIDACSERQSGDSRTSMKGKVKQRPWQLMRM
jgi:hypothetical protein